MLIVSACAPVVERPAPLIELRLESELYESREYVLQPGDQIAIRFFYTEQLNDEVAIRPDGRISLQLIDEIVAAGRTPKQLAENLRAEYGEHVKEPRITVSVQSVTPPKVFVGGEVGSPGVLELTSAATVLQSITSAGGFKETARRNEVILIRQRINQAPLVSTVNMEQVLNGTDVTQDLTVMPYDIIHVPRSPIANQNLWVKQYLVQAVPYQLVWPFVISNTNE